MTKREVEFTITAETKPLERNIASSVRGVEKNLKKLDKSVDTLNHSLAASSKVKFLPDMATQINQTKQQMNALEESLEKARQAGKRSFQRNQQSASAFAGVLRNQVLTAMTAIGGALGTQALVRYADDWKQAANRLKGAGVALEDVSSMQDHILRIANKTNQSFTSTADLLASITIASQKLGTSQSENLELAENLQKAFMLSGTSQNAISGALTQISQGLGSGQFQSEELNSIFEASPLLTDALLEEFKVNNVKALKELAAEGEITADRVAKAFLGMSSQLDRAMQNFEPTVGQAFTRLANNATAFFGKIDEGIGITDGLSTIILALADNLEEVASIAGVAGGALAGMAAASVIRKILSMAAALRSMAAAGTLMQAALFGLNPVTAILAAIGAAIAGIIIYKDDFVALFDAPSAAAARATQAQTAYKESIKDIDQAIEQAITISSDLRSEIDKANDKTNQRIDRLRAQRQELIANTRAELQRKAAMAENAAITANQRVLDAQKVIDNVQGMGGNTDNLVAAQKASSQEWQTQIALSQKYYQQLERFEQDINKPAPTVSPASSSSKDGQRGSNRRSTLSDAEKMAGKIESGDTRITEIIAQQAADERLQKLEAAHAIIENTKTATEKLADEEERLISLEGELTALALEKGSSYEQIRQEHLKPYEEAVKQAQEAEQAWITSLSDNFANAVRGARDFEEALSRLALTLVSELLPELAKLAFGLDNIFDNSGAAGNKSSLLGSLIRFGGALIGEFGGSDFTAQAGSASGNLATLGGNSGLTAGFAGSSTPLATLGGGGFGGFRASGGPVEAGRAYIVGEQGPELLIPRIDGRIFSNSQSKSMMAQSAGGSDTTIVFNNYGSVEGEGERFARYLNPVLKALPSMLANHQARKG